ncbi:Phage baseplate assembly protein V [Burkholderia multivorans]
MDSNEFRRLIVNLIRKGSVAAVDLSTNPPTCRVSVGDPDDTENPGLTTNWLPFFAPRAGTTREWNPLTVGEKVLLFCPMGDPAQGVVLGGLFSGESATPSHSADKHVRSYPDGATYEYDHASHVLNVVLPAGATINVTAPDAVNINTKQAAVTADEAMLDADVTVTRSLTVKGPFTFESGMRGKGGAGGGKTIEIEGGAAFTDDVVAAGVSVAGHDHMVDGVGAPTSEPRK